MADDCLILGAGVVGLSLAYELAGCGLRVQIVDRQAPGQEASWAGAGILPPANYHAPSTPDEQLAFLCHELHPRWSAQLREETGVDNEFRRTGGLYLAGDKAEAELLRWVARDWAEHGLAVEEVTTPEQLAELEPALAPARSDSRPEAAIFLPDEAQIRNPRHLKALIAACELRGVTITPGATVEDFVVAGGKITAVRTAAGELSAGVVCLTGGSWTRDLLAKLDVDVALRPIRGQIALLNTGAQTLRRIVNVGPRYLVPRGDGRVLVGSTEEDVGFEKRNTADAIAELLRFAFALAPSLASATLETCWAGLRPTTPDGRPYLGWIPGYDNALVAAGHFRSGLQLSPGTAVLMRQLIMNETPQIDLESYRVDRA